MSERDPDDERRLRRAAVARHGVVQPEPGETEDPAAEVVEADEEETLAARRIDQQGMWVEFQIRKAMERGDFDNLPGAGKPLRLPDRHDPDWWVKSLIERENIKVAPPAIGLRREDQELDETLDREAREEGVRRVVDDFNRRVVEARRQLSGGPPVVTRTRDADAEVEAWRVRRATRSREARQRGREREQARLAEEAAARAARPSLLRRALQRSQRRRGA